MTDVGEQCVFVGFVMPRANMSCSSGLLMLWLYKRNISWGTQSGKAQGSGCSFLPHMLPFWAKANVFIYVHESPNK
jgi:hypothetical protein